MRSTTILFAAAIVGAVHAGPAAAAPDQTQGVALMSATVAPSGVLVNGAGAVSSQRTSLGNYQVTFVRGFNGACTAVASPLSSNPGAGHASVFVGANSVLVETDNTAGGSADLAFSLIVFCPK